MEAFNQAYEEITGGNPFKVSSKTNLYVLQDKGKTLVCDEWIYGKIIS